tara:strand:+ start:83 stop:1435 length:1353 start_codon:yes stop_codon:yes gene_type:complete
MTPPSVSCDVTTTEGLLACENDQGEAASSFATSIADNDASKVYWFANRDMVGCDPDEPDRLVHLRILGAKLRNVDAKGSVTNVIGMRSTCIDVDDDFTIYFPPTKMGRDVLGACKRKMQHTAANAYPVRVSIVFAETPEVEGVDMGVYNATDYTANNGNFLILKRCREGTSISTVPTPRSIGVAATYKEYTYRSHQEMRVAVLLEGLDIPFLYENAIDRKVYTCEGAGYEVDFMIYPADRDRVAYLEVKPYKPHRGEIAKAVALFRRTDIPVFVVWGSHFVQGVGVSTDKDISLGMTPRYTDGIQAMKIHRGPGGNVTYEEGYYFMASDRADGGLWEEDKGPRPNKSDVLPIVHDEIVQFLDRGVFEFGERRKERLGLTSRLIRKTTRLVSPWTKKCYRPARGFRAYLFKDSVEGEGDMWEAGPNDAFSRETRSAFEKAEHFRVTRVGGV